VNVTRYDRSHLNGVLKICAAEDWPSVPDTAQDFYASFQHHTYNGFRIYPG
jgi:hypothetical protein